MDKKGFTLVELLAVISILAILVILALPNIIDLFKEAKKNSFYSEVQTIYSSAQKAYMLSQFGGSASEQIYTNTKGDKKLSVQNGTGDFKYCVTVNGSGKITNIVVTNGEYIYESDSITDKPDINNVSLVADDYVFECAGPKPTSFTADSWETIKEAIQKNDTSMYLVGDTKQIDMGSLGTHTVRIANKSNSSDCSKTGQSQTACGFVIEFADVVTTHRINPFEHNGQVNGDGQKGGWEHSEIRQFVNNDVYNALPADLKSMIIDTYVVSGYGNADNAVFKTTDKLYLLAYREIKGGTVYSNITDSAYTNQLEYYSEYNNNASIAIKKLNNEPFVWCLRTPFKATSGPIYYNLFYGVRSGDGFVNAYGACTGVSPAFRIG